MAKANYGELYNILGWGDPYFTVNAAGNLCVSPHGRETMPGQEIDVKSVIDKVLASTTANGGKPQFPMILRFHDVLEDRIKSLHNAFYDAIESTGYNRNIKPATDQKWYQGVFPIKVNQNKAVVQDMVDIGKKHGYKYGLEAGSKPELLIAMSCLTRTDPEAYLICNGYKDADYIDLALAARTMGLNVVIVLEMEEELDIVIEQYEKLKEKLPTAPEPVLGVRAKLLTRIPGHFGSTAGKHGKFGMLAEQIYEVAKMLRGPEDEPDKSKLHWLQLLHFHIGSMIPTTEIVFNAAKEAAGIYCTLVNDYDATSLKTLDCGGGLGVDYDGTRSGDSDQSVAYGIEQYASSIVQAVRLQCEYHNVRCPILCTESGRAMASHQTMIILEALSAIPEPQDEETSELLLNKIQDLHANLPRTDGFIGGYGAPPEGIYSHASDLRKHGIEMYKLGKKLGKRVVGDNAPIYNYHMNLSVFSLVPDFWGIGQLFPMMPVTRLNEAPTLKGTLVDITCDSDGKIEKFIGGAETLPLHDLKKDGHYYVAVLVAGAYQEALAGKHNLISGPTLVRVTSEGHQGGYTLDPVQLGPTADEVIASMRYDVQEDITNIIQKAATGKNVWEVVEPLMTKALTTMPYLNEYKTPPTISES
ncbi:hypothetical protein BS78_01G193500 [Paspalum vaginatum]|nr:hypothetical protein BS78_01G193500 [Paspalum vaginatum]KAJ1295044.1 hypothetical protein BS78_01G193500 [Paspalum vaginatum]KAJ1295045.1 hypothetical protein BS78_01G193500 [Paspalum vaginatum]